MALTAKQQRFVDQYFTCNLNATKAALEAGYSAKTAYSIGWENLRKPEIKAEIDKRLNELAMPSSEVLARLSDQARSTMEDFIDEDRSTIDLAKADRAMKLHLIKKFTHHISKESETLTIELYDAQAALIQLGRAHGIFIDKTDLTSNGESLRPVIYLPTVDEHGDGS